VVLSFGAGTRAAGLTRMAEDRFDVLVIGGGITGAGIALDAAARGLSVALVEKDDFASGTSGRSSRLVHGGLRYLEHGELGLVREALAERGVLRALAPHLVRPVPMYMLAGDRRGRARYRLGLAGYDLLAAGRNVGGHRSVTAGQVREAIPGLGFRSPGFRYFECQTDDARLTIEVARTAGAFGALLANHARAAGLLGGARVTGAVVVDEITGERLEVRAGVTVNAGGVWADRVAGLAGGGSGSGSLSDSGDWSGTGGAGGAGGAGAAASAGAGGAGHRARLVPSKGVHLVFAPGAVRTSAAVVLPSAAGDGRYVFVVPWEDRAYAGTTDTPYAGDLDHPDVGGADRDYILSAVARAFPGVTERDVVASWAGLRPLLTGSPGDRGVPGDRGAGGDRGALGDRGAPGARTSDLSRRHAVFDGPPGLLTITGGKLTTYRAMAEDLVDRLAPGRRCLTRRIPIGLHGPAAAAVSLAAAEAARLGLPRSAGVRLVRRYGDDWREAVRMIGRDASLGEPAADGLPVLAVELELARVREMAITEEDVLVRRTRLATMGAITPSAGPPPG
jgi:glycerol-3-phosphate dehydrogenase